MTPRILVIDDEPRYVRLMEANLKTEGFEVIKANDGQSGIELIVNQNPNLVLLDIMMPKMDGFATCQRIREFSMVPIIMVTAKGEERDRVRGLNLGADDYIVKPFSAMELLARVRAVLRRAERTVETSYQAIFNHDELQIDLARAEVFQNQKIVYLSATEYRILIQLAQNVGKVIPSEQLLRDVWGNEYITDKEILWVSISRLRQKLEENPHEPKHIVTRSGLGYIMPALDPG
jgi:DNA-binding response OmpR family regulator